MRSDPPPYAREAIAHLTSVDPVMAGIIAQVGALRITHRPESFQALVRAIIFQQLAGSAAQAIFGRFVKLIGNGRFPSAATVLGASDELMRQAGLSRGKMTYIRDLAAYVESGKLSFARFRHLDDEGVIADLTRVRGIGRWTAEMYLMFNLRRPDVLPVGDLGFRNAVMKAYGMSKPPTPKELRVFGERWRPYRSAAVWYLWQSARTITPDTPPPAVRPRVRKGVPIKSRAALRSRV